MTSYTRYDAAQKRSRRLSRRKARMTARVGTAAGVYQIGSSDPVLSVNGITRAA